MGKSKLVFLLGHPLSHSLSPAMMNAAFPKMGLDWTYVPLDIPAALVQNAVRMVGAFNVMGANVTVPHKEAVLPYLDELEPEAGWLGSVNTIYRKGGKLWGASTDGEGFLKSLGDWRKKLRGSRGLLIGAGGAAKAVAGALGKEGVKGIIIANRTPQRAGQLLRKLLQRYKRLDGDLVSLRKAAKVLPDCDWVIQATSLGLRDGDLSPLLLQSTRPGTWVVDLIYHRKTDFLREAEKRKLPFKDGLGMLLHQGSLALERWTGKPGPFTVMQKALLKSLLSRRSQPDNR